MNNIKRIIALVLCVVTLTTYVFPNEVEVNNIETAEVLNEIESNANTGATSENTENNDFDEYDNNEAEQEAVGINTSTPVSAAEEEEETPEFEDLDPRYLQSFGFEGRVFPTGNYSRTDTDIVFKSAAFDFALERTFNSQSDTNGVFGYKWKSVLDMKVAKTSKTSNKVKITLTDGNEYLFYPTTSSASETIEYISDETLNELMYLTEDNIGYYYYREIGDSITYKFSASTTKLIKIIHETGNSINIGYSGSKISYIEDTAGNKYYVTYDANKKYIIKIELQVNGEILFQSNYNYSGINLTSVEKNGVTIKYAYGYTSNITSVKYVDDTVIETMEYITDEDIYAFENSENSDIILPIGSLKRHTDETGLTRDYSYRCLEGDDLVYVTDDIFVVTTTLAGQKECEIHIDSRGDIVKVEYSYSDQVIESSEYTYDSYHNMTSSQNTYYGITQYLLDANGRIVRVTYQDGYFINYSYNNKDKVTSIMTSDGRVVLYIYDTDLVSLLYRVECINPTYSIPEFSIADTVYNSEYYLIDSYSYYDDSMGAGLMHTHTDPEGNTTMYTRNELGNVICETYTIDESVTYEYDRFNRIISKSTGYGETTNYDYDKNSNLLRETYEPTNAVTRYVYDTSGRLVQVIHPAQYNATYDGLEANTLTDTYSDTAAGTRYRYISVNEYIVVDPENYATHFFVTNIGGGMCISESKPRLINSTETLEELTYLDFDSRYQYFYNSRGEYLYTYGTNDDNSEWYWSSVGKNTCDTTVNGGYVAYTINKTYDYHNYSASVTYYYDCLDRLVKVEYPDETSEIYNYIMYDMVFTSTDGNGNSFNHMCSLTTGGRLFYTDDDSFASECETYNKNGNLTSVSVSDSTGANIVKESYTYDHAGRVLTSTVGLFRTVYTYDYLGRCTKKQEYTADNCITTDYTYTESSTNGTTTVTETKTVSDGTLYNSTASSITVTTVYDKQGNPIKIIDGNGTVTIKTYDLCNRETSSSVVLDENTTVTLYSCTYDGDGNIIRYTDGNGNDTTYGYDTYGNLKTITDAKGGQSVYIYTHNGILLYEQTPEQNNPDIALDNESHIRYTYDSKENLTAVYYAELNEETSTVTSHLHRRYEYDGNGNLKAEYDADNIKVAEYTYDQFNRLITVKEPAYSNDTLIVTAEYEYDIAGNMISKDDYLLDEETYTYDLNGNVLTKKIGNETVAAYTYDKAGNLLTAIDSKQNLVYTYNELGLVKTITENLDEEGGTYCTTTKEYDAAGNLIRETDTMGVSKLYTYDKLGRVTSLTVTGADPSEIYTYYWSYDNNGNILSETDAMGYVTTYTYDANGNVITQTRDGKTVTKTYNADNLLLNSTDWNGVPSTYTYDYLGRVLSKRNADGVYYEAYTYDNNDNIVTVNNGIGADVYTYGKYRNELTRITDSLGRIKYKRERAQTPARVVYCVDDYQLYVYSFDGKGNVISIGHYYGDYEYTAVDSGGYLVTPAGFANAVEKMTCDKYGNILSRTDARGYTTSYTYNWTYLSSITYPHEEDETAKFEYFVYNSDGTLCYKQKRDGGMESYSYDALGRCVAIGATDANFETTGSKIFTYDKNGNLLFDGVVTRTYDAFGRVLTQSQAGFDTVTYTYDTPFELFIIGLENGYEETISSPELSTISKDYDSSGNLYATQSNADMVLYSYNAAGLCTTKHFTQAGHYTYYTYNTEGQITEITDGTVVFDYTYDSGANMTSETRKENGVVKCVKNYTYDKANRLVSETNSEQNFRINYTYDNANNITAKTKCNLETGEVIENKTYTYNANNQIAENSSYYDNGGIFCDSYYWYSYDGFDRLNMVYFSLNDGRDSYSYEYASDNLRTSTTQLAFMTDEVVAVTRYLYDKDGNILAEKKNNVLGNVYVYGNGLENLLIGYNVYRYTANAHGDIIKIYSGNAVVAEYDYTAYGENIKCTENGISNPIRYAGYYYDTDTEKYYLKNRYYDGTRGRFLTEDPYWNVGNMLYGNVTDDVARNVYYPAVVQSGNRFAYCMGNPVNYSDPLGWVVTPWDEEHLTSDEIELLEQYTLDWEKANKKNDSKGMKAAADAAEALRKKYREYNEWTLDSGITGTIEYNDDSNDYTFRYIERQQKEMSAGEIFLSVVLLPLMLTGCEQNNMQEFVTESRLAGNVVNSEFTNSRYYQGYNFTVRAYSHMQDPARAVPVYILAAVIENGVACPDPRGLTDGSMYYSTFEKNGALYNIEVLYDDETNTIYHFKYQRKAMGPLSAIPKTKK